MHFGSLGPIRHYEPSSSISLCVKITDVLIYLRLKIHGGKFRIFDHRHLAKLITIKFLIYLRMLAHCTNWFLYLQNAIYTRWDCKEKAGLY